MSYRAIASTVISSPTTEVVFSSLPTGFRDLVLVYDFLGASSGFSSVQFNGDANSNYSIVYMRADNTPFSAGAVETSVFTGNVSSSRRTSGIISVFDYGVTDKHKTTLGRWGSDIGGSDPNTWALCGRWANTAAITTFRIGSTVNFAVGSTFSLYGVNA